MIEYYLFVKDKLDIILYNLENNTLNNTLNNNLNNNEYFFYYNLISKLNFIRNKIIKIIYNNCIHNFLTDFIDIDLEKSKKIIYCSKCNLEQRVFYK